MEIRIVEAFSHFLIFRKGAERVKKLESYLDDRHWDILYFQRCI